MDSTPTPLTAGRTSVVHHAGALGAWSLWRRRPAAALVPFVVEMQGYEESGTEPLVRAELPSTVVPLILMLDGAFALVEGTGRRPLRDSFVAGLHTRPALVASTGTAACLQVNFTPEGARRALRADLAPIAGRVADLAALDGVLAAHLVRDLAAAPDWGARLDALEGLLAARLLEARGSDWLDRAALRLAGGPAVRVGALAEDLGVSRAHLHRAFAARTGLSPKAFQRVARFGRAVAALERPGRRPALADLALWCGYADQSHFNRDFAAFAGMPPRELLARALPDGTGLVGG